ncbi:uncharacterized protein LY89DRAFT_686949 [Mollisia scopiformis]|uniref:CFEM domain-containing protein n=1 Tax=Mollisia scopiformis TaxID=149040 RepID=A0A194X3T0_MOLSC|nr:uncharacterized protein LY89DRAFT_686949 [Mollisia scopiformis]KUJ14482.1 hypothetical protein LY89DRAFT_686949 [Mollisia scopiformis]
MKITISAMLIALAGLVSSQNFGAEPSCAIPCLTSAFSVAGCALTDQACQCGTGQAAIQTAVTPCLLSACDAADVNSAASVGFALCSAFSMTAGANATTTPSSSSHSSTSIIMSTPSATTSTVTAVTTSVGSGVTSTATTTSAKSSGTGSGTSSSASAVSSAGAQKGQMMAAGLGGVVGVLGAVVAAL